MGRRQRQREREREQLPGTGPDGDGTLTAPSCSYSDGDGNELVLRGAMTAATRRQYAEVLAGSPLSREDAWQRAAEYLFERLAVRWVIAQTPLEGQRELLGRLRAASPGERAWVRQTLREHCAEHFPELQTP